MNKQDYLHILQNRNMYWEELYNTAYNIIFNPTTAEERIEHYKDEMFGFKKFFLEVHRWWLHSHDMQKHESIDMYYKRIDILFGRLIMELWEKMHKCFEREMRERNERERWKERIIFPKWEY